MMSLLKLCRTISMNIIIDSLDLQYFRKIIHLYTITENNIYGFQ